MTRGIECRLKRRMRSEAQVIISGTRWFGDGSEAFPNFELLKLVADVVTLPYSSHAKGQKSSLSMPAVKHSNWEKSELESEELMCSSSLEMPKKRDSLHRRSIL